MNFDALGNVIPEASDRLRVAALTMADQHARTATALMASEVLQWATKYASHIPPHALRELAREVLKLKGEA